MHLTTYLAVGAALIAPVFAESGEATFYTGTLDVGACSFTTYSLPAGIYGMAFSAQNWEGSAKCGACMSITGPAGNSITAMVIDKCPGCNNNGVDLFPDAFSELASQDAGRINVNWEWVKCPIEDPLQVHLKDGASEWWFSAQIVNANKAVHDLQVSNDGGATWANDLARQDYNFFQKSGGVGSGNVQIKAVSCDGDEVIIDNVEITSENVVQACSNFS